MCNECTTCQEAQNANPPEPLILLESPSRIWCDIATDLFLLDGRNWIIIADRLSKFPIVEEIPKTCSSEAVSNIFKKYCGLFGIPEIVRSDNGPQYQGNEFQKFVKDWNIRHITSSPRYPQSNGFIERQIQTIKKIIAKTIKNNGDVNLALLRWRTTPIDTKVDSPAEIMFKRRIKDTLPFKPLEDYENLRTLLDKKGEIAKLRHDQRARTLAPLIPGQEVNIRNPTTKRWEPAIVREKAPEERSSRQAPQ